jgi:hypothetical protein
VSIPFLDLPATVLDHNTSHILKLAPEFDSTGIQVVIAAAIIPMLVNAEHAARRGVLHGPGANLKAAGVCERWVAVM